jgi:hypothetical protein
LVAVKQPGGFAAIRMAPDAYGAGRCSFMVEQDVSTDEKVASRFRLLARPELQAGPPGLVMLTAACETFDDVADVRVVARRLVLIEKDGVHVVITAPTELAREVSRGVRGAMPADSVVIIPHAAGRRLAVPDLLQRGWTSMLDGLHRNGLVGYSYDDFRAIFSGSRRFAFGLGRGAADQEGAGAAQAASQALAHLRRWAPLPPTWRQVQVGICGGDDLALYAVNEAALAVQAACESSVNLVCYACVKPELTGRIEVAILATSDP